MKIADIVMLLLVCGLFIGGAFFIKEVREEKTKCVRNPLLYGVEKYSKDNNDVLMCTCNFLYKTLDNPVIIYPGNSSLSSGS